MDKLTALAPAKIILTGEHSVVYGMPAIVCAVNRFAYANISPDTPLKIDLTLSDFKQTVSSTVDTLRQLKSRLLESYHLFLDGKLTIRQVLHKPAELFQFTLINLLDTFQMQLQKGFHLNIRSDIPMGCGMGSSAATIVSVLQVISHYLKLEIKPEWLHKLSVEVERLQHGFSSGVDSYVSLNGGCVRFQNGTASTLALPKLSLYLVNTGKPQSTTGECVSQVSSNFKSSSIWQEFGSLSKEIEEALTLQDLSFLQQLIRYNHLLLTQLGVVSVKVQHFIADVENQGGAAKICGAGTVSGEGSGVVLVVADKPPYRLTEKYGYELFQVEPESQGARVV